MGTRLFVDNLPLGTTEEALKALFAQDGRIVLNVSIMSDRQSGDSHGYAFVEMATAGEAAQAIGALHGRAFRGETLHVSGARPRPGSAPVGA